MPFATRNAVLLAKKETTYGTDPVPVAADAVLVTDLSPVSEVRMNARPYQRGTLSQLPSIPGLKFGRVSFTTELKWNGNITGTSATPWETEPLFKACGCSVTYTAEVGGNGAGKADVKPVSSGFDSVAIYSYLNGILHKLLGARGTFEIILSAGELALVNWEFTGLYSIATDAANVASPSYDSQKGLPVKNGSFTIGAYAGIAQSIQFALNNKLVIRESVNGTEAVAGVDIVDRDPAGSMNPEAVTEATYAFWSKLELGTEQALSIGYLGTTNGNQVKLTAGQVVFDSMGWGDRDGLRVYDIPFKAAMSAGEDEFNIEFN